jgi:hypothetical protein
MASTAHELIESIFSRVQSGVPGNVRYISTDQLKYLLDLIGKDEEGAALYKGNGGRLLWMPSGRHKYEIEGDMHSSRRKITRMMNIQPSSAGLLF